MGERKDVGGNEIELVPPTPTGNKATVIVDIKVMVEVNETDDWNDMVHQAKEQLRKRIVEGKGFFPFQSRVERIHDNVEVEELKYHTLIDRGGVW